MKYTIYCIFLALLAAASISAQFPQAERHRQKIEAAEKAEAEKEKAEAANRPIYPPARMNVDVQMVLTGTERRDFAAAKAAPMTKVSDGDPLWLYIKFNGALDRYVYRTKSPEGADRYILFLEIGPLGDTVAKNHYIVDLERADLALTELKISLSPGAAGHLRAVPVFLRNAAGLKPGVWRNEIRLTNTPTIPRASGQYLAKTEITCDLSNGVGKYAAALKNYSSIILQGPKDKGGIPTPGKFNSFIVRNNVVNKLSTEGIIPTSVYFAGDGWSEYSDSPLTLRQTRTVYSVFTYERGTNCLYGIAEITQKFNPAVNGYSSTEITLEKDYPTPCAAAK